MFESQGSGGATEIGSCLELVCPNLFFSPISEELSILKKAVDNWDGEKRTIEPIQRLREFTYADRLKDVKVLERILEIIGRTETWFNLSEKLALKPENTRFRGCQIFVLIFNIRVYLFNICLMMN